MMYILILLAIVMLTLGLHLLIWWMLGGSLASWLDGLKLPPYPRKDDKP